MGHTSHPGIARALDELDRLDPYSTPLAVGYLETVVPRQHPGHHAVVLVAEQARHSLAEIARAEQRGAGDDAADAREVGQDLIGEYVAELRRQLAERPVDVPLINTRDEMQQLAVELGVRPDWHEPDNQDVTVQVFTTGSFDNACTGSHLEQHAVVFQDGEARAVVNLAMLFAMAAGGITE